MKNNTKNSAAPKKEARNAKDKDIALQTLMDEAIPRLTKQALKVLERQVGSEDEKIAQSAAVKILALKEVLEASRVNENMTVLFQTLPPPGLPSTAAPDTAPSAKQEAQACPK